MLPILQPELNGVTVRKSAIDPELVAFARAPYANREGRFNLKNANIRDSRLTPELCCIASALIVQTEFHLDEPFDLTVLARTAGSVVAPHIDLSFDERFLVEGDVSHWSFGGRVRQRFGKGVSLYRGDVLRLNNLDRSLSPKAVRHALKFPESPNIRVGFLFCFNRTL